MISSIKNNYPYVVIIILNWNGRQDTLDCLLSIKSIDYNNFSTVIVDNGSEDDSVISFRRNYPDITVLETGKNLGYAGGNNIGMRWALEHGADYVLLLNNDTVVDPDILNGFVLSAEELKDGGLFGAKIYYFDAPNKLWNAGADWDPKLGDHVTRGSQKCDDGSYDQISESAYANGCALFARADVLEKVGLLDESFFLIYEETDLAYRATKAGYRVYYTPYAKVWHKVSISIGGNNSPIARYFTARNQLLWSRKHLSLLNRLRVYRHVLKRLRVSYIPIFHQNSHCHNVLRSYAWGLFSWYRQFQRNLTLPSNSADLLGLRDYFRSRFGDCPPEVRQLAALAKTKNNSHAKP